MTGTSPMPVANENLNYLLEDAMEAVDNLINNARISDECRKVLYGEYKRLHKKRYGKDL